MHFHHGGARVFSWFLAGMPHWKAPGPDGVQWYWIKKFTFLHTAMARMLNACLQDAEVPAWMNHGHTVLIMKDPGKSAGDVTNYRPITCLPVTWKLFSGILSNKITEHILRRHLCCLMSITVASTNLWH